jgi:hypothetical protein
MRDPNSNEITDIQQIFDLNETEAADLFGVDRRTVAQWRANGVPVGRLAEVQRVRELAHIYAHKFQAQRVPAIVRTPADGLAGKTVLEVIATSGAEPIFDHLARLFSYPTV